MSTQHNPFKPYRKTAAVLFATLLLCSLVVGALVSVASAATTPTPTPEPIDGKAPYYDGESESSDMTDWVPGDGNVTADGMLKMLGRIPAVFIGSGGVDPSGSGYVGVLLTGVVILAAATMGAVGTGVGVVGGSMLGMVLAFGMTFVGIVPGWIRPLLLFGLVGVPVARAVIEALR